MRRLISVMIVAFAAMLLVPGLKAQGPPISISPLVQQLYDPSEPGSVLVFPKFVRGTVGGGLPATEIEISVHCPSNIGLAIVPPGVPTGFLAPGSCVVPGTKVNLIGHWVCPEQPETHICRENNFTVSTTIEGTISFSTEGLPTAGLTTKVPPPPCPEGYLILWVVNSAGQPIKFDGLVGDAVVRWNNHAEGTYPAIAIQAANFVTPPGAPAAAAAPLLTGATLVPGPGGTLAFDGQLATLTGGGVTAHYAAVTGTVLATVKYDTTTPAVDAPVTTSLTLLTLDILSNRPNNEVFTDIDFYDASENVLSESLNFGCWTETPVSSIDANLTRDFMSRKGFFVSLDANKVAAEGVADATGPVTMLGLIDTIECQGSTSCTETVPVTATNNPGVVNHGMYRTFDDSIPVPTTYHP
jgi:hypothetical protein